MADDFPDDAREDPRDAEDADGYGRDDADRAHRVRVALRLAVAVVSLVALIGSGLAWAAYQNFNASIKHGDPVPGLAKGQRDLDGKDQNILLIGNDSRAGANGGRIARVHDAGRRGSVNTDTMMVLHVPAERRKGNADLLPARLMGKYPRQRQGQDQRRVRRRIHRGEESRHSGETPRESAGIRLLIRTITTLTGLYIDHYLQVNLLGFYRISNAIGGVDVCLLHAQNSSTDADQNGHGYSGINLPAGRSLIKGAQALAFVRQRHGLPDGDLDRIKRQQYFLSSAFHKMHSGRRAAQPVQAALLLRAVEFVDADRPGAQLRLAGAPVRRICPPGTSRFATIPNNGPQLIFPDGVETAIVQVDSAAIPGFINRLQGKPADPSLASAAAASPSHSLAGRAQRDVGRRARPSQR